MTKVLPSTFHYFDKHYSVIDDRRIFTALLRHASIPVTMVADMVIGIAYLIFLGIKRELNEELFWEISHQQLFEYPFQQFIYFLFSHQSRNKKCYNTTKILLIWTSLSSILPVASQVRRVGT